MLMSIIHARKIIERQVKQNSYELISTEFSKYQKGFYWTNENIAGYLNIFDLSDKITALSVAGTGDHVFNLVSTGIKEIDSFDINKLTEYLMLGLKRAMILKYNYYEFITFINFIAHPFISLDDLTDIITDLLPYMEKKHRIFWREICSYNYRLQKRSGTNLNLILLLYVGVYANTAHLRNNDYLYDEYTYEAFKSNLYRANITFTSADALDLPKVFSGNKYDLILLSNILDYANGRWGDNWDYNQLETYIKSLEGLTNDRAVIFLKYILGFKTEEGFKEKIFHDSQIKLEEIQQEIYTIPKHTTSKEFDGIILARVKIDK